MRIAEGRVRIGIHAGQQYTDYPSYRELFLLAEALGLDWASVFDHFMPIQTDPSGPCLEGYSLLAALAEATERLRLGVIVTSVTYRHPAVVAKMAATIDHISNGRVEIGLGAGFYELEHRQYGIALPPIAERSEMLAETAQVLRSLWKEKHSNFSGDHYQLSEAMCEPKPLQHEGIPLWIGGAGEKRTLPVVGRYADGWNTFLVEESLYRSKLGIVSDAARQAGRDPEDIRNAVIFRAILGATEAEARDNLAARAARTGVSVEQLSQSEFVGTPEACVERLAPYLRLGVADFLMLARPPVDPLMLQLLGNEVAPALRSLA